MIIAFVLKGDVVTATNFHERHQELATAVDIPEEQKEANKSLINVSKRAHEERVAVFLADRREGGKWYTGRCRKKRWQ